MQLGAKFESLEPRFLTFVLMIDIRYIRTLLYAIIALFTLSLSAHSQPPTEKDNIYGEVIENAVPNGNPIVNRTVGVISASDIDGDLSKWYQAMTGNPDDTAAVVMRVICVTPVMYAPTVDEFLASRNLGPFKADSTRSTEFFILTSSVEPARLVSLRRAPLSPFFMGNIFKKSRAVALSNILFNADRNLAQIKISTLVKRPQRDRPPSKIVILQKERNNWRILGMVAETTIAGSPIVYDDASDPHELKQR